MPIVKGVWYPDPTTSNVAIPPSSVRSEIIRDFHSYSPIRQLSPLYVPPSIHFGSLVFEHQGDFNLKLTRIEDPDLTRSGREVFTSWAQLPEGDLANQASKLNLDYEGSDDEINPYESRRVYMVTRDQQ